jgi:TonB family protein
MTLASDVLIQGEEDPANVSLVVAGKQAAIRACYDRRLAVVPDLSGSVAVRFEIGSTGAVTSALVVRSTLADPAAETCIVRTLRQLTFKRPKHGTVIVNYPFQFTPSGRAETQAVSTRLSERSVSTVLRKERPRFERCYQGAVDADVTLRGVRASLVFAIGDQGEAVDAAVDASATLPAPVQRCFLSTLGELRFARPVSGEHAKVTLPFILWGAVASR